MYTLSLSHVVRAPYLGDRPGVCDRAGCARRGRDARAQDEVIPGSAAPGFGPRGFQLRAERIPVPLQLQRIFHGAQEDGGRGCRQRVEERLDDSVSQLQAISMELRMYDCF